MNKYYLIVSLGVLAVAVVSGLVGWVWRAFYDQRKSKDFQRRRAEALAEGRTILNDLRAGERAVAGDDIRLPSQVFNLTLISLKELGTNEDEVRKLLVRSGARATARSLIQALGETNNEETFESFLFSLELVLEPHGWSLAGLGVTDVEKMRQECRLRIARKTGLEVTNLALTLSNAAAQLIRQCQAAGCQVKDLGMSEWVNNLVELARKQDQEPGPTAVTPKVEMAGKV